MRAFRITGPQVHCALANRDGTDGTGEDESGKASAYNDGTSSRSLVPRFAQFAAFEAKCECS